MSNRITSSQNPLIKTFRNFDRRKNPDLILLDGVHLHQEYHRATGQYPETTLVGERFIGAPAFTEFKDWPNLIQVPDSLMRSISPTKTPAGILSLTELPTTNHQLPTHYDLTLIFENVQDPGNLGTMLRTAHAFGPTQVLLLGDCCDVWNSKCLRAGMGAQFYVPCERIKSLDNWKQKFDGPLVGTSLCGESLWDAPLPTPLALVFGNEGQGLNADTENACDQLLKIPMNPNAESLNVAASLAVLAHEFRRQSAA